MKQAESLVPARNRDGFTIIETIIVLAIAGFIIATVLIAIPALSRNGRNNQRKQEVSALLQAVSRYELNNSASFPPDLASLNISNKIHFYEASSIKLAPKSVAGYSLGPISDADRVLIVNYAVCSTDVAGTAVTTGTDYTNIVALYGLETATGFGAKCQNL